jgi:hypothetical protein
MDTFYLIVGIVILSFPVYLLYLRLQDAKRKNDYKNSDAYKKTRANFIDKINKTKGKK